MALIKRSVKGSNLTPTEVDANFEFVGELGTSTSNTILFDRLFNRHGSWTTPLTGALVLDNTNAVDGATTVVIWSGSSNPSTSGILVESLAGNITTAGTYSIYFNLLDGRLNMSIFNVSGTVTSDTTAPATPIITNVVDADTTPPATPIITSIT